MKAVTTQDWSGVWQNLNGKGAGQGSAPPLSLTA
jgi:hypothetical protein